MKPDFKKALEKFTGKGDLTVQLRNAARDNKPKKLKKLIKKGVNLDAPVDDIIGNTATVTALSNRSLKFLNALIDAGIDLNKENKRGMTVLDFAGSLPEYKEVLEKAGAKHGSRKGPTA